MQGDREAQVGAWVEYFRDIGVRGLIAMNAVSRRRRPRARRRQLQQRRTQRWKAADPFANEVPSTPPIGQSFLHAAGRN